VPADPVETVAEIDKLPPPGNNELAALLIDEYSEPDELAEETAVVMEPAAVLVLGTVSSAFTVPTDSLLALPISFKFL
jgi:hypothetical protein